MTSINDKLTLDSQIRRHDHLNNSLAPKIDFEPEGFNKVRVINSEGGLFSMIDKSIRVKR